MARTGGRRSKITKEKIQKAYELIKNGQTQECVASSLNITTSTWHNWFNEGERISHILETSSDSRLEENLYLEFFEAIKRAVSDLEAELLKTIKTASERQWQASAWILERHHRLRENWAVPKDEILQNNEWVKDLANAIRGEDDDSDN